MNPSSLASSEAAQTPRTAVRPRAWLGAAIVLLLAAQALLWQGQLVHLRPRLDVVPPPPSAWAMKAQALGDEAFLHRWRVLELQVFGDSGGRATPLRQFDYARLTEWFRALDGLDPRSDVVPTIAAYIFGQTREPAQQRLIIDYLREHARNDMGRKFRWTAHAALLARHRAGDVELALATLDDLSLAPASSLPGWVRLMPAFLRAQVGEREAAIDLMRVMAQDPQLAETERAYLAWQIERLQKAPEAKDAEDARPNARPSTPPNARTAAAGALP